MAKQELKDTKRGRLGRPLEADTTLAKLRQERGFSREELCGMAQAENHALSYATLVQFERGERVPKVDLALYFADIFGTTVEVIFGQHSTEQ